jgi:hypothetical protein
MKRRAQVSWFIYYRIPKISGDKLYRVGPYSAEDYRYHRDDIAGYDGVTDVRCDTK